jgi:glycosyltransferase involved in cell wall biosynthesis
MPLITLVSGCYNEQYNIPELYERVTAAMAQIPQYEWDYIFADNASTDGTLPVLRAIAAKDRRIKVIVNNRNFGPLRSGYNALLQARGAAVIALASDLQDPPELIPQFIAKWEEGDEIVLAQKTNSAEFPLSYLMRRGYYYVVDRLSEVPLIKNVTGFGLYDARVIDAVRKLNDPYPYFRGLVSELGFKIGLIPFSQPLRKRGVSKNNFYTLYDLAMLGITNHSKVPLRLVTFSGFCIGALSLLVALIYLVYKLLFWNSFRLGTAPVVIGLFFLAAVQLVGIGVLGEYLGSIHTQVLNRPPVVERERINFED